MAGAAGRSGFVGFTNELGFKYRHATFSAAPAHWTTQEGPRCHKSKSA